jgi:hypothetical protein
MKRVTLIATAIVLAVLVGMSARVSAQNPVPSERTFMTFSNTVEMPGVTLPAGTYVFRIADTPTRNVVQVLSGDEKDILGQWTFVQAERPQVSGDTVVMFKESPEGTMPAVQYWYYPGERIGKEFIYPKDQAQKIANRTGQSVLSDDGRVAANGSASKTDVTASAGTQAPTTSGNSTVNNAPAPAQPTAPAGSLSGNRGVTEQAQADTSRDTAPRVDTRAQADNRPVGTSGAQAQPESTQARASELPRTASPAPLVGLIGLLSLAGALGVRRVAAARA